MAYLGKTPSQAVRSRYYFTASGSETSLSPSEVTGLSFTDANYVDVSLNGVALVSGTDYTATPSTNTISSLAALTASDVVEIVVYDTFSVFGGNVNGDFNISGGDLTLGDNDALIFGDGSDFKISHNGSKTKLEDTGTGNLEIRGTNIEFYSGDGGETLAKLTDDGAAELYHNNTKRIETSATGVDITGGFTASDGCTITTADNSQQLSLISTDADANVGPELHLRRNSASPANNDAAGEISFNANNDAGQNTNIVSVDTKILNVADGTEEGGLELRTMKAGSMRSRINMYGSTTVINDDSQDIDFRVESDGDANAFFVEGSSGNVGIGTTSIPTGKLAIEGGIYLTGSSNFLRFGQDSSTLTGIGIHRPSNTSMAFVTSGNERARVTDNGLTFNGDTAAANALDDYEEIDFSPSVSNGYSSVSYTTNKGRATKIGRLVVGHIELAFSSTSRNSGQVTIEGLPYVSTNSSGYASMGGVITYQNNFSNTFNQVFIGNNGTTIQLHEVDGTSLTGSETSGANSISLRVAFSYVTD
jgi:hypothetical protein